MLGACSPCAFIHKDRLPPSGQTQWRVPPREGGIHAHRCELCDRSALDHFGGQKDSQGLTLFHCATSGVTLCSAAPCSGLEARDFPFKCPCHLNQHLAQCKCTRSHLIPGHVQRACAYFHTPGCDDGLVSISWPQQDTTRVHVCLEHKSMWIRLLPQVQTRRRKTPLWLRRLRDLH